jgi:hypothetical protein
MLCVSPLGRVFRRLWAGMPSGIFCTQFFDSFYNGLMIVTCLSALGYTVDDSLFLKLIEDDALFALFSFVPVDESPSFLVRLSEEAFRRFGSKLSAEKCKTPPPSSELPLSVTKTETDSRPDQRKSYLLAYCIPNQLAICLTCSWHAALVLLSLLAETNG